MSLLGVFKNCPKYCRFNRLHNNIRILNAENNHLRDWKNNYSDASAPTNVDKFSKKLQRGPGFDHFLNSESSSSPSSEEIKIPYLDSVKPTEIRKVKLDIYGCQMNTNDAEIVWSILKKEGFSKTDSVQEADVVLLVTCAIREGAETKIWNQIDRLKGLKKKWRKTKMKIGILGCMAERLKEQLIEKEKAVDLVAGPDSYKDLPRLLALTENNQSAVNVLLSLDETYADVMPVRLNEDKKSAYVSIMRGCDNMCTYCIVPFTRGRERSRPIDSIVEEIKNLSEEGVKEVTLLGQNVNSYRDTTAYSDNSEGTTTAKGFKTVYKQKKGGLRFADLLDKVSAIDPDMRIRFTSPHPKDFPDEVLQIIKERNNICKLLHLPAQSGSSSVLERMRRGYTRESYIELVNHVRSIIPNVSLSSDFICGFCHETEEEFCETLTLLEIIKYNVAFLYPYSMREKTTAYRRYKDDVPDDIKHERHLRMIQVYRKIADELNVAQIGEIQLILVEGRSKRSADKLAGRNDKNIRVIIPAIEVPISSGHTVTSKISPGDYIAVMIESANSQILKGTPLFHTTLSQFDNPVGEIESMKLKSIV